MPKPPNRWNSTEDNLLRREVLTQLVAEGAVKDWQCIATKLPARTNKDCRKRWHNVVSGGVNKGHWTQDEDKLLIEAVKTCGKSWRVVATAVKSRNADREPECAKRWTQFLDPELDRSQWADKEVSLHGYDTRHGYTSGPTLTPCFCIQNKLLQEAHEKYGRRWKEIQDKYTILIRKRKQAQSNGIEDNEETSSQSDSEENGPVEAQETTAMDLSYGQSDDDLSDGEAMIDGGDSAGEQEPPSNEIDDWDSHFCSTYSHLFSDSTPADHMALDPAINANRVLSQCFPAGEVHCWDIPGPQVVQTGSENFDNNTHDPPEDSALLAPGLFPTPAAGPESIGQNPNLVHWHPTSALALDGVSSSPRKITLTVKSPCPDTIESLMRIVLETGSSFSFETE
ncbi:Myb transcription factor [Penicillium concentricum]|uniref:Myb transcription factor n=1 Tax=Penicillium concentricum TaxID=293559 RepID=A0A9W9RV36_9EURO|nr:Myb transcription factor [Penicillium concentricum]KAJ5365819.1 Myb transcription factor [Penicillium concentricum]